MKQLLQAILVIAIVYAAHAFCFNEPNTSLWSFGQRFCLVFLALVSCFIYFGIMSDRAKINRN
jgi:hypothetical protein